MNDIANFPWEVTPFERQAGIFWDPGFPDIRYSGTYFAQMDLPFVEIPESARPDRRWGLNSLVGILADSSEIILLAHEEAKHSTQSVRGDGLRFDRYAGVGALIGVGATSLSDDTLVRTGTLRVQNLERWMGPASRTTEVIGNGFMTDADVPEITATVERESRLLTIDVGVELRLRRALALLDEAQFLVRKAFGCLTGLPSVARDQRIHTSSGATYIWKYARWESPLREPLPANPSVSLERSGPAATIVNRFQNARQALWPVADVLYVNLSSPDVYSEHRFVSLISAIEGAHSKLEGVVEKRRWAGEQESEYKDARSALKKHFKDHGSHEMRDMLLGNLQNKRTLAQKLDDVFTYVGAGVEAYLRIDRASWIRFATSHRNTTAHAATTSTPESNAADDSSQYRALSIISEELLRQLLLIKMGVSDDVRESSALRAGSNLRSAGHGEFLAP